MPPLVTVHLLTFNGASLVERCLESVSAQTYPNLEVLVTDNNSTDGTIGKVKSQKSKVKSTRQNSKFKIFQNGKNLGFAAGHNFGIKQSNGEYILCLSQDVVLDKDFVQYAVEAIESDSKIAAVQGKLLQVPSSKFQVQSFIDTVGLEALKSRRFVNRGQGEVDRGQYERAEEIFGADGAAPLYRRTALEDVGLPYGASLRGGLWPTKQSRAITAIGNTSGLPRPPTLKLRRARNDGGGGDYEYFDEDFFLYKEDIDLAWRLRLAGWKTMYQPKAVAWHYRGAHERSKVMRSVILSVAKDLARSGGDPSDASHPQDDRRGIIQKYLGVARSRQEIPLYAKFHSFKNQRFLLLKNDSLWYFIRHLPWALPYEMAAWLWVIFFERRTWGAIGKVFRLLPAMLRKRRFVMARRRAAFGEIYKWFL